VSGGVPGLYYFVGPATATAESAAQNTDSISPTPSVVPPANAAFVFFEQAEALRRVRVRAARKLKQAQERRRVTEERLREAQQSNAEQSRREELRARDQEQQKREQAMEQRILQQLAVLHEQTNNRLRAIENRPDPSPWPSIAMAAGSALPALVSLCLSYLNRQETAELAQVLAQIPGKVAAEVRAEVPQAQAKPVPAPDENPSGDYKQPAYIEPLTDFEKQRVHDALRSTEQMSLFDLVQARNEALRVGEDPSLQATSKLLKNRETRRKLEQLFNDTRVVALIDALRKAKESERKRKEQTNGRQADGVGVSQSTATPKGPESGASWLGSLTYALDAFGARVGPRGSQANHAAGLSAPE